jgi:hypothetical protein
VAGQVTIISGGALGWRVTLGPFPTNVPFWVTLRQYKISQGPRELPDWYDPSGKVYAPGYETADIDFGFPG